VTDPGAAIRRCPECGEEFLPHVVHCSDCGALLENAFENDAPPDGPGGVAPAASESPDSVALVSGLTPGAAAQAAERLAAAGIAFGLVADARRGLRLGVERGRMVEAIEILEREGVIPGQPDPAGAAVGTEGGPCPACGDPVAPGTVDCPGCGLQLSGGVQCRHCGAELVPALDSCPECHREQD
jgi:hypothetical protein